MEYGRRDENRGTNLEGKSQINSSVLWKRGVLFLNVDILMGRIKWARHEFSCRGVTVSMGMVADDGCRRSWIVEKEAIGRR